MACQWNIDTKNGILTIGGGDIEDFKVEDDGSWSGDVPAWASEEYMDAFTRDINEIVIDDGVRYIGSYAFYGCSAKSVRIGSSVTSIGEFAFAGCPNLKRVSGMGGITFVGKYSFSPMKNRNLRDCQVMFEKGYYLGRSANPEKPKNVVEKPKVSSVSDKPTKTQEKGRVYMPTHFSKSEGSDQGDIGMFAFYGCPLEEVSFDDGVKEIYARAFWLSGVKKVDLPKSVSRIGEFAFCMCDSLERINLDDVECIEQAAFNDCLRLSSVGSLKGVKKIDCFAFANCQSLVNVYPSADTEVGDHAFDKRAYNGSTESGFRDSVKSE